MFSERLYQVSLSEDTPTDTEVLRVRARDLDDRAKLSYSIHSSVDPASMRMFRINPGTGVLYTADRLDYETRAQHILTVMVRNITFVKQSGFGIIFLMCGRKTVSLVRFTVHNKSNKAHN